MAPENTLAVISQTGESMSFFGTTTGNKTGQLSDLIPEPHELCLDRKRNVLYLTHAYAHGWYGGHGEDGHEISVIDCTSREVVDVIDISPAKGPHYALLDAAHDTLYACVEGGLEGKKANAGGVIAIDLPTKKIVKRIPSGYKAHWFVATPDFGKAYCCHKDGGFISVLDLSSSNLLRKIPWDQGNEQPSISADGRRAFFPTPTMPVGMKDDFSTSEHGVLVIDTATDEIIHRIRTGAQALTSHVTASGLLLVGQVKGQVMIFDAREGAGSAAYPLLGTVEVGKAPLTIISDAKGETAYVASVVPGTVAVVDLRDLKGGGKGEARVVRTLQVDGVRREDKEMHCGAHGMAVF